MNYELVEKYYENRWLNTENFQPYKSPAKAKRLSILANYFSEFGPSIFGSKSVSLLDYGCGSGWILPYYKFFGFDSITAYDVTPKVLNKVKEKYPWVAIVYGSNAFPSPLLSENYNLVTSIEVIEHIPMTLKKEYFADIHRILKKDGIFILTTPNPLWRLTLEPKYEQPIEEWVSTREIKNFAMDHGFRNLDIGSRGIRHYPKTGKNILLNNQIKNFVKRIGLKGTYYRFLEKIHYGITIHAAFQKK